MITQVITFWGVVQGVGFRPTLSRLAGKYRYNGQVRNVGGLVQLIVTDEKERIDEFIEIIRREKPRMSEIIRIDRETIDTVRFDRFEIVKSGDAAGEIAIVPADIAICDDCLAEFRNPDNPRHLHPFISCTNCGPRYSIMEHLPYDRDTTAMEDFAMCDFCASEYKNPGNRRYHAQTVSCSDCGPMPVWAGQRDGLDEGDSLKAAISAINSGGVIAFKGVGGYYFVCSPYNAAAVRRLREIKIREEKPFAVMFGDVSRIMSHCNVSPEEEALLTSYKRPIVLLERTGRPAQPFAPEVCNNSRFIGAFLPSMGLQYLLTDALGPLIMTSANLSDLPIIRDDEEILTLLAREPRIDGVLYNERRIVVRLDDSVARVICGTPQLTRRSKGYTPVPVFIRGTDGLTKDVHIFAAGGHLKSVFSFSKGSFIYMSQHIGDMGSVENERVYRENYARMREFFGVTPQLVVCDMHPDYFPTRFAEQITLTPPEPGKPNRLSGGRPGNDSTRVDDSANGLGGSRQTPCEPTPPETDSVSRTSDAPANRASELLYVQHHHAHVASVMAEHGISGTVIGVAFDGTGYGMDGSIWGGEILICAGAEFERFSHLKTVEMIGGDSSMKDGWKSAMSHRYAASLDVGTESAESGTAVFEIDLVPILEYAAAHDTLLSYEPERETVEAAILMGVNTVTTSSMGRLFDAVASLLGIHHVNRYEGECAIMLENAADECIRRPQTPAVIGDVRRPGDGEQINGNGVTDEAAGLALQFHKNVAAAVLLQCRAARARYKTDTVCISGGVFQNKILMEEVLGLLRADEFRPYYNIAVPPNDGGIALGQNYIGMKHLLAD
jgi:hydrogenase maturation protein HypF